MNIDRISYEKVFQLGAYINEKIRVEVSLEKGEDAKEALDTARNLVHEYHFEQNKELYEQRGTRVIEVEPKLSPKESLIADINSCKEVKVLESYKLIVKNNPDLQDIYDNKLKSLQNGL